MEDFLLTGRVFDDRRCKQVSEMGTFIAVLLALIMNDVLKNLYYGWYMNRIGRKLGEVINEKTKESERANAVADLQPNAWSGHASEEEQKLCSDCNPIKPEKFTLWLSKQINRKDDIGDLSRLWFGYCGLGDLGNRNYNDVLMFIANDPDIKDERILALNRADEEWLTEMKVREVNRQ